ncbi:hypothetical protein Salat_1144900 [Sesamum alatum]|uniref:RNase H type-1 domain-containing protein n=1 Tax=Sesamum alatum TaxID=300844 RepID=A0AAE1YE65_9LAMI|nr:hypothetical protein Salat_1144900 [Sesamum alatum]
MGVGVVARDHEGRCLGWRTAFVRHVSDAEVAEGLAARAAKYMATSFHGASIEVEKDYTNSGDVSVAPIGPILHDIALITAQHPDISVSFVRRKANHAAHLLARHAQSINEGNIIPSCILDTVQAEAYPN